MSLLLPGIEHVPLHRIWVFTTLQGELSMNEHAHIIDCEECRVAFRASLHAENFGALLKELNLTDEQNSR